MKVLALYRYAVKGLGPDSLETVSLGCPGAAFPDDRRYALIKTKNIDKFNPDISDWVFKQNFLCAFTYGEMLNSFVTKYDNTTTELTVWKRDYATGQKLGDSPLLGPVDLSIKEGQNQVAKFFEEVCGEPLSFVTSNTNKSDELIHQFGNTDEGFKKRGDSRTIHIVNAATVREVEKTLGIKLSPEQFRPNIVVDGLEAWNDFHAVGQAMNVSRADGKESTLQLEGLVRCVRCDGIGVDPLDPSKPAVDIPKLLAKNYPKHGPYLGIYVVVKNAGDIQVGDTITFIGEKVCSIPKKKSKLFGNVTIRAALLATVAGVALTVVSVYRRKK